jgi:uncharacterized protein (DUF2235 family)
MSRNIVICCDGTGNEPENRTNTNVVRIYDMLEPGQITLYVPGVGTVGELATASWWKRTKAKVKGLAFGEGLRNNVADAYRFLMNTYQKGDRIYLFGFSRGAYTVRALAGLLQVCGLLQKGNEALVHHAINMYWKQGDWTKADWDKRDEFRTTFGNPEFPEPRKPWDKPSVNKEPQIHFMGIWDTVKFVAGLQFPKIKFRGGLGAQWFKRIQVPFTRELLSVRAVRHAVSLDERRYFYREYVLDLEQTKQRDEWQEIWFAGVHSDIGGTFEEGDHYLADITLRWIADEAERAGLLLDPKIKKKHATITPDHPFGLRHKMSRTWWIAGGWRKRPVVPKNAAAYAGVKLRMDDETKAPAHGRRLPGDKNRYTELLPDDVVFTEINGTAEGGQR